MLDILAQTFKEPLQMTHTAGVMNQIANLNNILAVANMRDENAKNEALDVVCQFLQLQKTYPAIEQAKCCANN